MTNFQKSAGVNLTPYHQIKNESKESTGRPDSLPYSYTTAIFFTDTNPLIKYEIDETLEIKEEIIQEPETTGKKCDERYGSKVCTMDISEAAILKKKKPQTKLHEKIKELKPEMMYKCNRCARTYKQKRYLAWHQKFDCGVMPQFQCKFCGRRFKRKFNMRVHINTLHMSLKPAPVKPKFTCDFCGYIGKSKCNLEHHITSRHLRTSTKRFRESKSINKCLKLKEKIIQDPETTGQQRNEIYDLEVCTVNTIKEAAYHKKIGCKGKLQFSCKLCAKEYARKCDFIRHINCAHMRLQQFSCDCCQYKTNHEADFSKHIAAHHLQSSKKGYNCDKCSRSYNWSRDLTRHQRLKHAAVTPLFICDYCGFRTNLKTSLATHITKRHHKELNNY
ncbi:zinc finger protein 761-like [Belonocnema kinseyi]|uniref:zinc finger protein 761-like n=1 Tax=Belonocnema kinseyi TaxID=2817044 RepID=UPI00143DDE14|nr:zinc finger protein 761-like [Belonocnema kinseyi]